MATNLLDTGNIFRAVYDPELEALNTTVTGTGPGGEILTQSKIDNGSGSVVTTGQKTMEDSLPVVIASDQTPITVDGSVSVDNFPDTQKVSADSLPLPTGAATEAKQDTGNTHLENLDNKVPSNLTVSSNRLLIDGSEVTQPISAASLPLPSDAATESKQDAGNILLSNIDTKLPADLTVTANKLLVDGSGVTQPVSVNSLPLPSGAATEAKQDTGNTSLSNIDNKIPASLTVSSTRLLVDGSGVTQPVSGSVSVSNFPATQPISAVALPLPSGASTEAKQDTGNTSLSNIDNKLPVNLTVTSNKLLVDGSGVTQPVSAASLPLPAGAATETTLSSIDTKLPSNLTVSSTRLLVDNSGVTQPVSASSLPLPTGAATEAKQPALGTAGTASADVITVQGIASMTALKVDGSAVTQPVSGSVSVSNFPATQVVKGIGAGDAVLTQELTGLVPKVYDDIVVTYVSTSQRISTVTYKNSGSTVATLTMTYDGSDRLIEVART